MRSLAAFAAGLLVALGLDAFWLEPASLGPGDYDIALEGAPSARLTGLRIVVIADLHAGAPFIDEAKVEKVVALANSAHPDIIVMPGDFVVTHVLGGRHMAIQRIATLLRPLKAPLGIFAVLGNHDRWENANHIATVLSHAGVTMLDNRNTLVVTRRGPLPLVGIGDYFTHAAMPRRALAGLPPDAKALCFTHSPDVFPELPRSCLLTIAGHTHGGQVALPLVGRLIVPSHFGQRYAAGLVREEGRTLFVSTGIGTSIIPVRFRVPPEVTVLTIR